MDSIIKECVEGPLFDDIWSAITDPATGSILDWDGAGIKRPIHLHPNASDLAYDESDAFTSSIYRTSYTEFRLLSLDEIHEIMRARHILVYDVPHRRPWDWDKESMEKVYALDQPLKIQGSQFHIRNYSSSFSMTHRSGSRGASPKLNTP